MIKIYLETVYKKNMDKIMIAKAKKSIDDEYRFIKFLLWIRYTKTPGSCFTLNLYEFNHSDKLLTAAKYLIDKVDGLKWLSISETKEKIKIF